MLLTVYCLSTDSLVNLYLLVIVKLPVRTHGTKYSRMDQVNFWLSSTSFQPFLNTLSHINLFRGNKYPLSENEFNENFIAQ